MSKPSVFLVSAVCLLLLPLSCKNPLGPENAGGPYVPPPQEETGFQFPGAENGWVSVNKTTGGFMMNGQAFYAVGATNYSHVTASYTFIDAALFDLRSIGCNTIRLVDMVDNVYADKWYNQGAGITFDHFRKESCWIMTDYIIAAAERFGMKALLDLSTFRSFLFKLGKDPYDSSAEWDEIVEFVTNRRNVFTGKRYKDDPAILCWAIMGEPVPANGPDNFNPNFFDSGRSPQVIVDAILYVAGKLKQADPNHLVQTGGLLHFDETPQVNGYSYFEKLWRSDLIDFVSVHYYPNMNQNSIIDGNGGVINEELTGNNNIWKSIGIHKTLADSIKKPFMVEEFGYNRGESANSSLANAETYLNYCFAQMDNAGVKNAIIWNWDYGFNFDVGPQTPSLTKIIEDYNAKWGVTQIKSKVIPFVYPFERRIDSESVLFDFESDVTGINRGGTGSPVTFTSSGYTTDNSSTGERSLRLGINITSEYGWSDNVSIPLSAAVPREDWDYVCADVYMPDEVLGSVEIGIGVSARTGTGGNGDQYIPTDSHMRANFTLPGCWKTVYFPLDRTASNALEFTCEKIIPDDAEIMQVLFKVTNRTTVLSNSYLLIDNVRLIKMAE